MEERVIDDEITLVPYYQNVEEALKWYQDKDVVKQVDNRDELYTVDLLNAMYNYLSTYGSCYYIRYNGKLVGDVALRNDKEVCIVVCKEFQNKHIGRRCILDMVDLAREKGFDEVTARIYPFNMQSIKMFETIGFTQAEHPQIPGVIREDLLYVRKV